MGGWAGWPGPGPGARQRPDAVPRTTKQARNGGQGGRRRDGTATREAARGGEGKGPYPQHLLRRGGILLEGVEQPDGDVGRVVGRNRLGQRLDAGLELALVHVGGDRATRRRAMRGIGGGPQAAGAPRACVGASRGSLAAPARQRLGRPRGGEARGRGGRRRGADAGEGGAEERRERRGEEKRRGRREARRRGKEGKGRLGRKLQQAGQEPGFG